MSEKFLVKVMIVIILKDDVYCVIMIGKLIKKIRPRQVFVTGTDV